MKLHFEPNLDYQLQLALPTLPDAESELAHALLGALPAEKERLHIRHSTNFRGFSQMKNSRDWREQLRAHWAAFIAWLRAFPLLPHLQTQ